MPARGRVHPFRSIVLSVMNACIRSASSPIYRVIAAEAVAPTDEESRPPLCPDASVHVSCATLDHCIHVRGKRSAMQNSRIMLNQPKAGAQGDTFEVSIAIAEANRQFQTQAQLLHQYTDLPVETCEELLDRETYLSAKEAQSYNIIDHIL